MTLKQAFTQWAKAPRNTVLAARSRDAVQRVLMKQYGDMELKTFTGAFCRRLFSECRELLELQVKAASVLVYVLQWGGDHGHCQRPTFTYGIATEEHRKREQAAEQPAAEPKPASGQNRDKIEPKLEHTGTVPMCESDSDNTGGLSPACSEAKPTSSETSSESSNETTMEQQTPTPTKKKSQRGSAPRPVVQIDPTTLQPVKEWSSMSEAASTLGCLSSNIHRAVTQLRTAAGFYWCDPENAAQFKDLLAHKKASPHSQRALATSINRGKRKPTKAEADKPEQTDKPSQTKTISDAIREADENLLRIARKFNPRFKLGDDVWSKSVTALRGRTGVVTGIGEGPEGLTYDVQFGVEIWKLSESDLEPVSPAPDIERLEPVAQQQHREPLDQYTDQELSRELKRRGWQGELTKTLSV